MALDVGAPDEQTTQDTPAGASSASPVLPARPRRDHLRWLLPLVLVVFAGGLRLAWLGHPERIYFDETYYAKDSAQLLEFGVEAAPRVATDPSRGVEPSFVVHPPVGKWLIATGIAVFGDNSVGWRVAPALAGTGLVLMTYLIGLRLFRRRGVAALAAFLLAIEGLALTSSRIAMLDVFLALFVALGVWCLLIDRDRRWALVDRDDRSAAVVGGSATAPTADVDAGAGAGWEPDPALRWDVPPASVVTARRRDRLPRVGRRWLWFAGLAFGLALATKWSALLAIGAAGLYLLGSELAWRRAVTGRWYRQLGRLVVAGVGALIVVPAIVYVASYSSWFANYESTRPGVAACSDQPCTIGPTDIAVGWFGEQQEIFRFHRDLEVTHNYRASATLWPLTRRPVVYYYESCPPDRDVSDDPCAVGRGEVEEILGLGNPGIWWLALPVYPMLLWAAVRRRDRAAATIAVFLLGQYLPWLVGTSRPLFFFYALPLAPFVVLSLAWAANAALRLRPLRWVPAAIGAVALAAFVYFVPVYYGLRITEEAWRMRMWLDSWI